MKSVTIYTDGSSFGNPGPSAWCSILIDPKTNRKKIIKGSKFYGTNNEMELQATLSALQSLKEPHKVSLYTDSAYVANVISEKIYETWIKKGWKTSENKPVHHKNLWMSMLSQINRHRLRVFKVKGHAGDEMNDECDRIAKSESRSILTQIYWHEKKTSRKSYRK